MKLYEQLFDTKSGYIGRVLHISLSRSLLADAGDVCVGIMFCLPRQVLLVGLERVSICMRIKVV